MTVAAPAWIVALLTVMLAACGASSARTLTVFAAASLNKALSAAESHLESAYPGFHATYSFAGSQQLAQNLIDGAPADVIATADTPTMQRLVAAHLVDSPRVFAHNVLEIAVAPGNPRHILAIADLARADVAVVLADPSVPAGKYAAQMLARAGVSLTPKSLELNVEAALEKVESGDADAAVVYRTDIIAASGRVDGVPVPAADNVVATYPIAVVKATQNAGAAQAFVSEVISGGVHDELLREGFIAP